MTFEHIFINLILSDLEVWPTGTFRPFSEFSVVQW